MPPHKGRIPEKLRAEKEKKGTKREKCKHPPLFTPSFKSSPPRFSGKTLAV
jgi:hypothetical protein